MRPGKFVAVAAIALSSLLAACGTTNPSSTSSTASAPAVTGFGVVESIQPVSTSSRSGPGLGTIAGGVVGGVLGNQVGSGRGRTAATAAGVIGGAVVGNQVEQRNQSQANAWQLGIRMDNGSYATVTQESAADISVGQRVRIDNGRAYRY